MADNPKPVDITPSPRVLRMLGQIDFAPWQCLSELIDNSIDAFIDQTAAGTASANPQIWISLPKDTELKENRGFISVRDNASGMPLESLKKAVQAGYSGNDPVEKMGLFGMGFNISTARMGRRTEVWTTRAEDESWIGLEIDFEKLEKGGTFLAPIRTREKTPEELEGNTQGTEIRIELLERDRVRPLIWGAGKKKNRDRLGKVYGRVMTNLGIKIYYDDKLIKPYRHCVWDRTRYAETAAFGNVPAVIEIDEKLDSKRYCHTCWQWLTDKEEVCVSCNTQDGIILRPRRLKGWLGIQRYFDKKHYGIDLIRNGRVIEELDKSLFTFVDENGEPLQEYPVDALHWGGRIVGELEIDFVRVSHQKDSFDKLDPEWKRVIEVIRGNAPIQPNIAKQMGLGKNESPLSRLFTAYRKGDAGLKYLVPGTAEGRGQNKGLVEDYVNKFYEGDPEYQSDEKWYELVLLAESAKRGNSKGGKKLGGEFPIGDPDEGKTTGPQIKDGQKKPEAVLEKPTKPESELDDYLSGTYQLSKMEIPELDELTIKVEVFRHNEDVDGRAYKVKPEAFTFRFDYNPSNDLFENSLETPADYLVIDLANYFLTLANETIRNVPVSRVARALRNKYFSKTSDDLSAASIAASSFLEGLRLHFDSKLPDLSPISQDQLNKLPRAQMERVESQIVKDRDIKKADLAQFIEAGKFAAYFELNSLPSLVNVWPELVTDGNFFDRPYQESEEKHKPMVLNEILLSLQDVAWLEDEGVSAVNKNTAWRLRYSKALASLRLLEHWRV